MPTVQSSEISLKASRQPGAIQRCAPFGLFAVVLHESTSTSSTKLSLFSGDDADLRGKSTSATQKLHAHSGTSGC